MTFRMTFRITFRMTFIMTFRMTFKITLEWLSKWLSKWLSECVSEYYFINKSQSSKVPTPQDPSCFEINDLFLEMLLHLNKYRLFVEKYNSSYKYWLEQKFETTLLFVEMPETDPQAPIISHYLLVFIYCIIGILMRKYCVFNIIILD